MGRTLLPALRGAPTGVETKQLAVRRNDLSVMEAGRLIAPGMRAFEGVETKRITYGGSYSSTILLGNGTAGVDDRAAGYDLGTVVIDGFERVVWVYKCVQFISGHQARLPFRIGKNRNTDDEQIIEDHPLLRVMNGKANPLETGRQFRKRLSAQVLLSKKGAFVEIGRSKAGTIVRLDLLPPDRVRIVPDRHGDYIDYFEFTTREGVVRELSVDKVRWIRDPHPTDPFCGTTPLEAAGISIELDYLSKVWNSSFIKNDARPGGIVGVDTDSVTDEEMDRIERRFAPGATEAGKLTVIGTGPGGLKYVDTTTRPRDMGYSELAANAKVEILSAFGLDESVVGSVAERTFDNAEQALYNAWTQVMADHNDLIASAFDADVDPEWDPFIDTSSVEVMELPKRKIRQEMREEVAAGLRSVNEYRPAAGLDPVDSPYARALWISPAKAPIPAAPEDAAALGIAGPGGGEAGAVPGGDSTAAGAVAAAGGAQSTAAQEAVEQARSAPTAGSADAALVEARADMTPPGPGEAADVVAAARGGELEGKSLEAKALNQPEGPVAYTPDEQEAERLHNAVAAALDALTARQLGVISARIESPKARKGTKFWAPDGPEDTRGGDQPLDTGAVVDEDRWAQEVAETLAPIAGPAGAEAAVGLYGALLAAGLIATAAAEGEIAAAGAQASAAVVLGAVTAAGEAMRAFLRDVARRLDREQLVASSADDLVAWLRGHYEDVARDLSDSVALSTAQAVVNGARDAAAASLTPAPPGAGRPGARTTGILRTWVSRRDDRVRDTHRALDGAEEPVGTPFVTTTGFVLRWPGDLFAPPQETRGCRCRLHYRVSRDARYLLPPT